MVHKLLRIALFLGAIIMLVSLTVAIPLITNALKDQLAILGGFWGYLIAFILGVCVNALPILPTPTFMPTVVEIAERNSTFWVAGVYAAGSALGESTAYIAGNWLNKVSWIQQNGVYKKLESWMHGRIVTGVALFLLAAVPGSPFDVGGAIAGGAHYPYRWFLVATFAGRWIKYGLSIPAWSNIEGRLSRISWLGDRAQFLMIGVVLLSLLYMYKKSLSESARDAIKKSKSILDQ